MTWGLQASRRGRIGGRSVVPRVWTGGLRYFRNVRQRQAEGGKLVATRRTAREEIRQGRNPNPARKNTAQPSAHSNEANPMDQILE